MSAGAERTGATPRWFRLALAAIALAGAAGWVAYAVGVDVPRLPFNDARNFHLLADGLASGDGYVRPVERVELGTSVATAEYPPLFPAVLSVASRLGFDGFGDHQVVAALLAATAIPLSGLLGRRLAGPVAGLAAAALVALHPMLVQLGASLMSEALYLHPRPPGGSEHLDGSRTWKLRFEPGALPPVDGFWSLTVYERTPDGQGFLIDNPIDRCSLGDRSPGLVRERDGALEIVVSPKDPGGRTNWLPGSQRGSPISLSLRTYLPRPELIHGQYRLPSLRAV